MPSVTPDTATQVYQAEGWEGRYENFEVDGGINVGFETYGADADWTEPMKELPGGCCQAPHWGYCFEGRITFIYDGREETFEAGQAFYVPGGHTVRSYAGSRCLYFSPKKEAQEAIDSVMSKIGAA